MKHFETIEKALGSKASAEKSQTALKDQWSKAHQELSDAQKRGEATETLHRAVEDLVSQVQAAERQVAMDSQAATAAASDVAAELNAGMAALIDRTLNIVRARLEPLFEDRLALETALLASKFVRLAMAISGQMGSLSGADMTPDYASRVAAVARQVDGLENELSALS